MSSANTVKELGRQQLAITLYKKALELNPPFTTAVRTRLVFCEARAKLMESMHAAWYLRGSAVAPVRDIHRFRACRRYSTTLHWHTRPLACSTRQHNPLRMQWPWTRCNPSNPCAAAAGMGTSEVCSNGTQALVLKPGGGPAVDGAALACLRRVACLRLVRCRRSAGRPRPSETTQRRTECRHSVKGTTTSGICDSSKGSSAQPSRTSGNCDAAQLAAHRPCRLIAASMPLVQALPGPPPYPPKRARAGSQIRTRGLGQAAGLRDVRC